MRQNKVKRKCRQREGWGSHAAPEEDDPERWKVRGRTEEEEL